MQWLARVTGLSGRLASPGTGWSPACKNVWLYTGSFSVDIRNILLVALFPRRRHLTLQVSHGAAFKRFSLGALASDTDFFCNASASQLFFHSAQGDPATAYGHIELALHRPIFSQYATQGGTCCCPLQRRAFGG